MALLRPGLLEGVSFAHAGRGHFGPGRLQELGATAGARPRVVVWDASAPPASVDEVRAALDDGWDFIRSHTQSGLLDRGGLIVLIAPPPGDAHAEAARAGLENLARTLSIEWARFDVRPVTVLSAGDPQPVAELVAYLASPAGDYFSGCVFALSRPTEPRPSPP